jgi:hypothetical protein
MTISENILVEDSLRATAGGFAVEILLNWYRSLPLSCVETIELEIDGVTVPRTQIRFVINGKTRSLDELEELANELWYIQDHAVLTVERTPPLYAGQTVNVKLRLGSRIPYILTGPASALENVSSMSRQMTTL